MKTKSLMIACIAISLVFSVSAFAGTFSRTLTVGSKAGAINQLVDLPISISGTGGEVGGVTFTLTYNPAILDFIKISQAGSQSVTNPENFSNGSGGYNNPYTTAPTVPTTTIFFQVNDDGNGTIKVAAASAQTIPDGIALFNAQFKVIASLTTAQTITITQTHLTQNMAAGYTEIDNPISTVVGMLPTTSTQPLDTFTTTFSNGQITVGKTGDVDGNGTPNVFDIIKMQRDALKMSVTPPYDSTTADINQDGTVNVFDIIKMRRIILGLPL